MFFVFLRASIINNTIQYSIKIFLMFCTVMFIMSKHRTRNDINFMEDVCARWMTMGFTVKSKSIDGEIALCSIWLMNTINSKHNVANAWNWTIMQIHLVNNDSNKNCKKCLLLYFIFIGYYHWFVENGGDTITKKTLAR